MSPPPTYTPRLPSRSNSQARGPPPADAAAPDDKAVDDVYEQVDATGSLEAAAIKLQKVATAQAQKQRMMRWEDDPEEAGYLASSSGAGAGAEDDNAIEDDEDELYYQDGEEGEYEDEGEDGGLDTVVHLQEIVEGLWVGDLVAAMDAEGLEARGISNILSLLRPRLTFAPEFAVYPLEIDDSPDSDILSHLPVCVAWIAEALRAREAFVSGASPVEGTREKLIERLPATKPGGVLVHCQAGMSRSATVTAAYIMVALGLGPEDALEMIRERRPVIENLQASACAILKCQWKGFAEGPEHEAVLHGEDDNAVHKYVLITDGDGSAPPMDKMARYPATPTPSQPPTPSGGQGRRKIRCKSCRRLLAVREHMMDHILDQSPISRPRTPSVVALPSPRIKPTTSIERKNSISDVVNPLTGLPGASNRSRHSSMSNGSAGAGILSGMTPLHESTSDTEKDREMSDERVDVAGVPLPRKGSFKRKDKPSLDQLRLSSATPPRVDSPKPMARSKSQDDKLPSASSGSGSGSGSGGRVFQSADQLNSRLPPQLLALRNASGASMSGLPSPIGTTPAGSPERESSPDKPAQTFPPSNGVVGAARRLSLLALTPTDGTRIRRASSGSIGPGGGGGGGEGGRSRSGSGSGSAARTRSGSGSGDSKGLHALSGLESLATGGMPILVNPKCSGYFVEPLTWMEPFLRNGDIGGKIICPNEKCGAKIGNYDWAGVQCGCKEWVTPGFCIHKSKVDEVW